MEDRKKPIMWDRKAVYTKKGINRNLRKYTMPFQMESKRKGKTLRKRFLFELTRPPEE